MSTKEHKEAMWSGKSNIMVAVRCRPMWDREKRSSKNMIKVLDNKVVVVRDPAAESDDFLRANRARDRRYAFDYAADDKVGQVDLYNRTTVFLIDGVVNGYNATVFAYGATGAGKTYTMLGNKANPGVMLLTLRDLYNKMRGISEDRGLIFKVTLSYIEVYNENIRDLLVAKSATPAKNEYLDLREDPVKGPQVAGVTEVEVKNTEAVMDLLARGNKFRTQEPTKANKESSRSHAVLQILVESKEPHGDKTKIGKLSLIDLAGSERASKTENRGARLVEGANINRSLLALGNVINALAQGRGSHIPYRDSKLTRMLKDSLGGNCRTVMIANVGPAASSFEETINTLKYANRAKNIKTKVSRNVLDVNYHVAEYEKLIKGLRSEVQQLKDRLSRDGPLLTSRTARITETARMSKEDEAVELLRDELVEVFQRRMALRRDLIELQAASVQAQVDMSRKQVAIARFQAQKSAADGEDSVELPSELPGTEDLLAQTQALAAASEVERLQKEVVSTGARKAEVTGKLKANEEEAARLVRELESRVTSPQRRELLTLEYRVCVLALENMELEHTSVLHQKVVAAKEHELHKLYLRIATRDKVIEAQRAALEENGLGHLVDYEALEAVDASVAVAAEAAEAMGADLVLDPMWAEVMKPPQLADVGRSESEHLPIRGGGGGSGGGGGGGGGFIGGSGGGGGSGSHSARAGRSSSEVKSSNGSSGASAAKGGDYGGDDVALLAGSLPGSRFPPIASKDGKLSHSDSSAHRLRDKAHRSFVNLQAGRVAFPGLGARAAGGLGPKSMPQLLLGGAVGSGAGSPGNDSSPIEGTKGTVAKVRMPRDKRVSHEAPARVGAGPSSGSGAGAGYSGSSGSKAVPSGGAGAGSSYADARARRAANSVSPRPRRANASPFEVDDESVSHEDIQFEVGTPPQRARKASSSEPRRLARGAVHADPSPYAPVPDKALPAPPTKDSSPISSIPSRMRAAVDSGIPGPTNGRGSGGSYAAKHGRHGSGSYASDSEVAGGRYQRGRIPRARRATDIATLEKLGVAQGGDIGVDDKPSYGSAGGSGNGSGGSAVGGESSDAKWSKVANAYGMEDGDGPYKSKYARPKRNSKPRKPKRNSGGRAHARQKAPQRVGKSRVRGGAQYGARQRKLAPAAAQRDGPKRHHRPPPPSGDWTPSGPAAPSVASSPPPAAAAAPPAPPARGLAGLNARMQKLEVGMKSRDQMSPSPTGFHHPGVKVIAGGLVSSEKLRSPSSAGRMIIGGGL